MITPERRAELEAEIDELLGLTPSLPKPKVVVSDGVVIRDADVHVSPADRRNSRYGTVETVAVRRADWVTINKAEADRRWEAGLRAGGGSSGPSRSRSLRPRSLGADR